MKIYWHCVNKRPASQALPYPGQRAQDQGLPFHLSAPEARECQRFPVVPEIYYQDNISAVIFVELNLKIR